MITAQEILWLVVDASGAQGLSPVQVQKTVFLVTMHDDASYYEFKAEAYGPASLAIYDDLAQLVEQGHVYASHIGDYKYCKHWRPTVQGHSHAPWIKAEPRQADYIRRVIAWMHDTSFHGMIKAVVVKYPEYGGNLAFSSWGSDD